MGTRLAKGLTSGAQTINCFSNGLSSVNLGRVNYLSKIRYIRLLSSEQPTTLIEIWNRAQSGTVEIVALLWKELIQRPCILGGHNPLKMSMQMFISYALWSTQIK